MPKVSKLKALKRTILDLDMSDAARMKRAADQGFDTPSFHYSRHGADIEDFSGSGGYDLSPFGIGPHVGTKEAAIARANTTSNSGAMYPLIVRKGKQFTKPDGSLYTESELSKVLANRSNYYAESSSSLRRSNRPSSETYLSRQKALADDIWGEYDSIPYINEVESPGSVSYIMRPDNIRSTNAAFDPAKKGSSNLLAGLGAGAVGASLLAPEEAQADVQAAMESLLGDDGSLDFNKISAMGDDDFSKAWNKVKNIAGAGLTLGTGMVGGLVGEASKLGGLVNPLRSPEDVAQSSQAVAQSLTYPPSEGAMDELEPLLRQLGIFEEDISRGGEHLLKNSMLARGAVRGYNALNPRIQGIMSVLGNFAL